MRQNRPAISGQNSLALTLDIKNEILIETPKWKTQGFVLNCDVEALISLIDQLAGGSRFFNEETEIRVEDACMEIEEIISCLES